MSKKRVLSVRKILLLAILGVMLSVGSITLAKYVIEEFHGYYLNARHFYFTSNRLKKDNPTYVINNWSGVGTFNISFNLSSKKNDLVYANYDIPYTVEVDCPTGVSCTADKPTGTIYHESADHSDRVTITVAPSGSYNEGDDLAVEITATSVSPYVEKIKATFDYVVGKRGITYTVEDEPGRPYMVFKITSAIGYCTVTEAFGDYDVDDPIESSVYRQLSDTDKAKCAGEPVVLTYTPNLILLDTTSNIVNTATIGNTTIGGVSYVNRLEFDIEPLSTVAIKFYKVYTSSNYTYPMGDNSCVITVS